jgi:hypothetical protein
MVPVFNSSIYDIFTSHGVSNATDGDESVELNLTICIQILIFASFREVYMLTRRSKSFQNLQFSPCSLSRGENSRFWNDLECRVNI